MLRIIEKLSLGLLILLVLAVFVFISKHVIRKNEFIERAFYKLRTGKFKMFTIDFKTGGSASVIFEHSCCNGAGFNAVAVRTSDGQEFISDRNYCGIEAFDFGSEESLEEFISFIEKNGYRKR